MMKKALQIWPMILVLSCAKQLESAPNREFNNRAFIGLVSTAATNYEDAVLDYDLDGIDGKTIHITRCGQVDEIQEQNVSPSAYPLLHLLRINCLALKRYAHSSPASRTCFPKGLTTALIASFPASAVVKLNDEDMANRQNKILSMFEKSLKTSINGDGSASALTVDNEWKYTIIARADFDGDGAEDLLIRVDWRARDAFGSGTDLLLLSRPACSDQIRIIWRS